MNLARISFLTVLSLFASVGASHAILEMSFDQVGDDVRVIVAGTANLNGLSTIGGGPSDASILIDPSDSFYFAGSNADPLIFYGGVSLSFNGSLGTWNMSASENPAAIPVTGDAFGFFASDFEIQLPDGYVSGSPFYSEATFSNQTLTDWAINYDFTITWGGGSDADRLIIVPEPQSSVLVVGLVSLAVIVGRRQKRS